MNQMRNKIIFLIIPCAVLLSCKKEKTTWNTDWSAPIAYGHLTINDMIPVDYTMTNTDNYLSLVYHDTVYAFSIDTLIKVPDTVVVNKYAIGLPSFSFNPGAAFPTTLDQFYNMGDIELKRVIVKSGISNITMQNTWPDSTFISFNFPQVFDGTGANFTRTYVLPGGSSSNPSISFESIDMANYDMDLTGSSGTAFNTLYADFLFGNASAIDQLNITNLDTIYYIIEFKDVIPKYAKGYFGQHYVSDTIGLPILPMKKIVAGMIDIDSVDMTLTIKNGFKLIAQNTITKLTGINSKNGAKTTIA